MAILESLMRRLVYVPLFGSVSLWIVVLTTLTLSLIVHFLVTSLVQFKKSTRRVQMFNGPKGHWFKGHIDFATFSGEGLKFHMACTTEFKTAFRLWFGPLKSALILCHPDTIKAIQSSNAPKEKFVYSLVEPFLGNGLIISDGQKWFRMRKLLTPSFHFEILKPYMDVFYESTNVLLDKWSKRTQVELFSDVSLTTMDIILTCALSLRSNCQTQENQDPYIHCAYEVSRQCLDRLMNPLLHPTWLYMLTAEGRQFYRNCAYMRKRATQIMQDRQETFREKKEQEKERKKKHLDFLDSLLEARDESGDGLSDEEIVDEVLTFMFAGQDTTTSAICWLLYNLARFPEHQKKCRAEVDAVYANKKKLDWRDLSKLNYLHLCIKESMRLHPSVPFTSRQLDKTYEIDGKMVPEGTWVMTNVYGLHHNPHVWNNPEDFDPSRFSTENLKHMSPYVHVPFSAGPRNCIGMSFALAEIKTSLAMILRKYEVSVDEDKLIPIEDLVPELILRAKNGIHLNITPRRN